MARNLIPLSSIANIIGGFAFKHEDFGSEGSPVVKIANITPPAVDLSDCDLIPEAKIKGLDRFKLSDRDIVMAMTGATIGKVGRIRAETTAYLNQRVAKISAKRGKEFDDFVYAVVSQPGFADEVNGAASGSAQANISTEGIGGILIEELTPEEQLKVGEIVALLDDKIELNRQMNRTLEVMAQALFKSWFVDFDPVTAKAAGRKPYRMKEGTAALFPDAFEDSELGEIPKGWRVEKVGDCVARHSVGKKYDQFTVSDKGKVAVLDQGRSGIIGFHDDEPGVVASPENPVIVFANHTCYMRLITFPFSAIQNVLPFTGRDLDIFWLFYATNGIQEFLEYKGHWPDFVIKKIVVPPKPLAERFGAEVKSWMALIHHNEEQSKTLTNLRDALLPKLLSGEVRVRQAENLVAEAI